MHEQRCLIIPLLNYIVFIGFNPVHYIHLNAHWYRELSLRYTVQEFSPIPDLNEMFLFRYTI